LERERRERALARANEKIPNGNQPGRSATECTNQVQRAGTEEIGAIGPIEITASSRVIITKLKQMKNTKTHLVRIITAGRFFSISARQFVFMKLFLEGSGACWAGSAIFLSSEGSTRPPTRRPLQNFLIKIGGIGTYKTGSAAAAAATQQHFTSDAAVLPTDCERQINTAQELKPWRYCFPSCSAHDVILIKFPSTRLSQTYLSVGLQ
jgi:hypothetical protein